MKKDGFGVEYDIADLDKNPDHEIDDLIGRDNLREDPERAERIVAERGDDDEVGDGARAVRDPHESHVNPGEKLEPLGDAVRDATGAAARDREQLK